MNWSILAEVSREITFEMIRRDTGIVVQNLLFVKPVRLLFVLIQQPFMVLINLAQGPFQALLPLMLPMVLVSAIFFCSVRDIIKSNQEGHRLHDIGDNGRATIWALFFLAGCSILPAIAFYAQSHTVLDIGILASSFFSFTAIQFALGREQISRPNSSPPNPNVC